jgi:predicted metal-dependent hydrolase
MLSRAELTLAGRAVSYTLRRSPRAKWASGWIRPETGLVVTLPLHSPSDQAEAFLLRHQRWVLRQLDRLARRSAALPRPWPYGTSLLYRGEAHAVDIQRARPGGVERTPHRQLVVRVPSAGIAGARRVLQRWLTREAEAVLGERVETWGTAMGLRARRVYVRNLRRQWGSCWPGGSLSFNPHLIMAPPAVLDYVVVHELAHLKERNHSPRFWALVAAYHPEFKLRRAWLRTHGPWLAV